VSAANCFFFLLLDFSTTLIPCSHLHSVLTFYPLRHVSFSYRFPWLFRPLPFVLAERGAASLPPCRVSYTGPHYLTYDMSFALKMEAKYSTESSVNFKQTTWRHVSDDFIVTAAPHISHSLRSSSCSYFCGLHDLYVLCTEDTK
jgi:hypothetical protein